MTQQNSSKTQVPEAILEDIRQQLQSIQFGSLEISVHNGQVVQLERRDKKRYNQNDHVK